MRHRGRGRDVARGRARAVDVASGGERARLRRDGAWRHECWPAQSLNLRANSIGDRGVTALARALCVNSSLRSLNVLSNDHTAAGAAALSTAAAGRVVLNTTERGSGPSLEEVCCVQ